MGSGDRGGACGSGLVAGVTRDATPYSMRRQWVAPDGYGVSADQPVPGYYRTRLRSGGMFVGVRIWFGPPHDPVTGEEMDRSHRWQAEANGRYIDFDRVWPGCASSPIDEAEYRHLASLQNWAVEHAPDSAVANPSKALNPLQTPLVF